MATTRFGHLDDFTLKNSKVGIGTSTPTEALEVIGGSRTKDIAVTGIASLTSYEGFQNKKTSYTENILIGGGESGTLSGEVVIGAGTTMNVGTGATTGQGSVKSLKVSNTFTPPIGGTNDRPSAPQPGAIFYNKDFKTIEYWDGNFWRQVDNVGGGSRGYIAGGYDGSAAIKTIDLINISTLGNVVEFGDSTIGERNSVGRASSRIEGFSFSNGSDATILVFTLSSKGRSVGFGENNFSGTSTGLASATRALSVESSTSTADIDYIEMSTRGNAIDFGGDLSVARNECGAVSSSTRGIICGGGAPSGSNPQQIMDFVTISSKGGATTFGDLTSRRGQLGGGVSDGVRGAVASGGHTPIFLTSIDSMTIASEGSAIDFGNLKIGRVEQAGATCNRVRGLFCAGYVSASPNRTNSIEYITIASSGNAEDFGDLTKPRDRVGGGCISDSHGGLGGF